jgi:tRNA (guanine10-N2)-methyltransferase
MELQKSHKFLVHFLKKYQYLDFCLQELESLSEMFGVKRDTLFCHPKETFNAKKNPTVYVNLPSEDVAKNIVNRSILIKEMIDVIAESSTLDKIRDNVDKSKLYPILEAQKSFRFNIEGVGKKISQAEQKALIDGFEVFPFKPKIDLNNPEVVFTVLDIADDNKVYFGREVAAHKKHKEADTFYTKFDLRKRPYLGPTSTDHELAFLMAN